jgi:hypothetical protein
MPVRKTMDMARMRALVIAILAGALLGCPGRTTTNQVSQHVTVSQTIPTNKTVHLLSATVTSSTGEFTWATSLTGTAGDGADAPVVVSKTSFAGAAGTTDLDVVDTGDLLPLFPTQDFKVYWLIDFAGTLTQSYPNGIDLTVTYELDIE